MKLDLRNRRPKVEKLPDGRLRATLIFDVLEMVGRTKAEIVATALIAYGTEATGTEFGPTTFSGLRLINQHLEGLEPTKEGALQLVRVYEELPATGEIQVGSNTRIKLEDGREAIEAEFLQFSSDTFVPGTVGSTTAPGDSSAYLKTVEEVNDGTLRRIKRTYVYAGTISQSDESLNGGALLKRTIVSVKTAPSTPSGYTLVGSSVQNPNGLPVYTYSFYKGNGEASRDTDYFQSSDEGVTGGTRITITHLTAASVSTDPTSSPGAGYARAAIKKSDQDGHRVWTVVWAVGTGIVVTDVETKNGGKLIVYHRVGFGTAPTAPTATISGTITATRTSVREAEGHKIYDYEWSEGFGEISRDTRFEQSSDAGTTGVTIITVRHLTPVATGSNPISTPSGTTLVSEEKADQDGYRIWTATYASGTGTVLTEVTRESDNQLIIYHRVALGSAPSTPSPTTGGTVVLVRDSVRQAEGYMVYDYTWAEGFGEVFREQEYEQCGTTVDGTIGIDRLTISRTTANAQAGGVEPTWLGVSSYAKIKVTGREDGGYKIWTAIFAKGTGTVVTDITTRNNGKLKVYHRVAIGAAPSTPSPTISGTVTLVSQDTRMEAGFTVYDYRWVEGNGLVSVTTQERGLGLRTITYVTLGIAPGAAGGPAEPTGIKLVADTDEEDGLTRYTYAYMQSSDGGSPINSADSLQNIVITNPGSGYTSAPTVVFTGGGGTGATATATIADGVITSITITNPGSGYTSTPTIGFAGGGGSGVAATAVMGAGVVNSVTINSGGNSYTTAPVLVFTGGGGTGAAGTVVLSSTGVILGVSITNGGTGYTSAPTVSFTGGGGSGAAGTVNRSGTAVQSVTMTNNGSGYTSAPTVGFTGGGGSGATATCDVRYAVASVTMTNPGSGYTSVPAVSFSGGGAGGFGGSIASGTAVLARVIASATVTNGGTGYTSAPTVSFSGGGGSGGAATAVVSTSAILGITLTAGGTGFTSAPTISFTGGGGTGATATAIVSSPAALTLGATLDFLYPGRAKATYFVASWLGTDYTALDRFLSPPIEAKVDGYVSINYQASAEIGALPYPRWLPREWATMNAIWFNTSGHPRSNVEGLRGYRAENGSSSVELTGITANVVSCFGEVCIASSTARVVISGGPDAPDDKTWVLDVHLEHAFTGYDGTKYYRRTFSYATIPAQAALPAYDPPTFVTGVSDITTLKAVSTTTKTVGTRTNFFYYVVTSGSVTTIYWMQGVLTSGTLSADTTFSKKPDDYNSSTNAKYWSLRK